MFPTEDVLRLLDVVLENNTFTFNNTPFIQTKGTAIGSQLGMNYACTCIGEWEKSAFEKGTETPNTYFRYVDDCWGI